MGTRETRLQRGRRNGEGLVRRLISELRVCRQTAGVSQRTLAAQLGLSQAEVNRIEQLRFTRISMVRIAEMASILGLEVSAGLHPQGDPIRDKAQQPLIKRFLDLVGPAYERVQEAPFPAPGDLRSWDVLLRIDGHLVGMEAETRVSDIQSCVRKMRQRTRSGGTDEVLLVLSDTAHHRRIIGQLLEALGPKFATPPAAIVAALRAGRPLPGSGVILV